MVSVFMGVLLLLRLFLMHQRLDQLIQETVGVDDRAYRNVWLGFPLVFLGHKQDVRLNRLLKNPVL
jgi:hypothetical protein